MIRRLSICGSECVVESNIDSITFDQEVATKKMYDGLGEVFKLSFFFQGEYTGSISSCNPALLIDWHNAAEQNNRLSPFNLGPIKLKHFIGVA